ncbi:MAG: SAM-dependent methyltransferase [Acidobacteria bacterium]|nr:SAM-dependent methyltransferase [Acidobacteriota bacterium]
MQKAVNVSAASFRDPSGRVFTREGRLLRQVNTSYSATYDQFVQGGLYKTLVDQSLLVSHVEIDEPLGSSDERYRILEPERIRFISYPFEWCFSQLKQAALLTLRIQRLAIERGMTLKDASAYNIQFIGTHPVFIDTLSFDAWHEGSPWVAYRQFCQHFLAPLALMSHTDVRLGQLSRLFIDGVPLDFASHLLPWRTRLRPALLMHLHLHARAQSRHGLKTTQGRQTTFTRAAMMGLIDHLESAIDAMTENRADGPWADYYDRTNYSAAAMAEKQRVVGDFIEQSHPSVVWDLGANTGLFSQLASTRGAYTIALDGDATAVERHFRDCRSRRDTGVLPLVMDLANPSSGIGWCHEERMSLLERGPADLILALGLVHHLRITNQVPFSMIAESFARSANTLVVEFPSPADSQVRGMLARLPAHAAGYTLEAFESAFSERFTIDTVHSIGDSERRLYLMKKR